MINIKIIIGSTRPARFGIQPAEWVFELAKKQMDATFELIDLQDLNLPMLDEPVPAVAFQYTKDHTKKWSKMVDETDGFIFITPEYNHGTSAALKNAIDYLAREWGYKPASFISYGADAGGARAIEHLISVTTHLRMYPQSEHLIMPNYWTQMNKDGKFQPSDEQTQQVEKIIENTIFWAKGMKPLRAELAKQKA